MKLHFLTPNLGKFLHDDGGYSFRDGYRLSFVTEIMYLKEFERPNWISIQVLGFGIGVSWGGDEDCI